MEHTKAVNIAESMMNYLRPACERIEIAGSIRRGKTEVKDIEIVVIPDLSPVPRARAEFGKPAPMIHKTKLDAFLYELVKQDKIFMQKDGERYKKFIIKDHAIAVDLFIVLPPAQWGVQFTIRTGPADFSHWIVTRKKHGGALPNLHRVQDGAVWEGEHEEKSLDGQVLVGFETEVDFLNFLGLGWIEPGEREAHWSKR